MPILRYLYFGTILALVLGAIFWGEHRYGSGVLSERTKHLEAIAQKDDELSQLRRQHDDELSKLADESAKRIGQSDKKIGRLLSENKLLRTWWDTPVPPDVIAFIWLRKSANHQPLSGRQVIAGANTNRK